MSAKDILSELDKIPYDAALSFEEPSKQWCESKGLRKNNIAKTITTEVPRVDLTGKWILITGANSGIGREAAITFSSWGANIILACRQAQPTEPLPQAVVKECITASASNGHQAKIEWWEYDAADLETVSKLAERWLKTGRPLDILCNNAGVGSSPSGNAVFKTKDGFEFVHQINLLSQVLLTLSLLPALEKAEQPRVVCTTSCFHFLGTYNIGNFNGDLDTGAQGVQFYKNNKLYFQIWLTELQHRLLLHKRYKHITVNGFHPGYVASGIWNVQSTISIVRILLSFLLNLAARLLGITSKQGSWGLVYVATATECGPDPRTQGVGLVDGKGGGRYFNRIWEDTPMPHCRDRDARLRVWRKLNDELKLKEKGLLDVLGLYSGQEATL